MASDFVMTIEDDLEEGKQPAVEDDEEELLSRDKTEYLNTSFAFNVDDDETDLPWNFDSAKKALMTEDDRLGTTINDKIQKRIQKKERREEQEKRIQEKRKENSSKSSKRKREERDDKNEESEDDVEGGDDDKEDSSEGESSDEELEDNSTKKSSEGKEEQKVEENETKAKRKKPSTQKLSKEAKSYFAPTPEVSFSKEWEDMSLAPILLKAIRKHGYATPTPIQAQAIPIVLMGRDICGSAVTGSGKTAAFVIPIIQLLLDRDRRIPTTRVLILTPTRELAAQCQSYVQGFAKYVDLRSALVVGGLSVSAQETQLRTFPDIIVATPGRMIDHLRNAKAVGLDDLELLVLDEADRLLDMGFTAEIEEIVRMCPEKRQTLLFSATMTDEVKQLIKLSLRNPVRVSVDKIFETAQTLTQEFIKVQLGENYDRDSTLLALCMRSIKSKCLIFFAHKREAHRMKVVFGLAGLNAAELHGDLTQSQRLQALEDFRDGKVNYLLATDVAARGLDILGIETIINYTMPRSLTDYVHRVGRTARAGSAGRSISLVSPNDKQMLKQIMKKSQSKLKQRTVPTDAIQKSRQIIEDMGGDIAAIFKEERFEKEIRIAERETTKIQNMIDFEDQIYSRPKKTWFQSSTEKENIREQSKQAALGIELPPESKKSDKSEKKLKKKLSKDQRKKDSKEKEKDKELRSQKLLAKSLKKKQREIKQGLRPREPSDKPKKKKQKVESGGSVFENEIKTSNFKKSRDMSNKQPKKGKGAFKSKSRYKRRK